MLRILWCALPGRLPRDGHGQGQIQEQFVYAHTMLLVKVVRRRRTLKEELVMHVLQLGPAELDGAQLIKVSFFLPLFPLLILLGSPLPV